MLRGLTHVGEITEQEWTERFEEMREAKGTYFVCVFVLVDGGKEVRIVGTGTLVVERKL